MKRKQEETVPRLARHESQNLHNIEPWDERYVNITLRAIKKMRKYDAQKYKEQMKEEFGDDGTSYSSSDSGPDVNSDDSAYEAMYTHPEQFVWFD